MKNLIARLSILPVVLLLTISPAQAGTITGDTITCATNPVFYLCSASSAVDGPGVEFTLTLGPTSLTADFGATGLVLTNPDSDFTNNYGPGLFLSFTDSTNPFTSATFLSSTNGLGAGNVSFSSGTLTVSVSGVDFSSGSTDDIGLTSASAATPEPETFGLVGASMLLGMLGIRLRKTSAETNYRPKT